jgi:hypothetical protein
VPKRLAVFKEAVPNLKEVAVLVNPVYPGVREGLTQMEVGGRRTLGVRIRSFEVRAPVEPRRRLMIVGTPSASPVARFACSKARVPRHARTRGMSASSMLMSFSEQ